jgi:hypothetical protein
VGNAVVFAGFEVTVLVVLLLLAVVTVPPVVVVGVLVICADTRESNEMKRSIVAVTTLPTGEPLGNRRSKVT